MQERLSGLQVQLENLSRKKAELSEKKAGLDRRRGEFSSYAAEKKTLARLEEERQRKGNHDAYSFKIAGHQDLIRESRSKLEDLQKSTARFAGVETALREKQQSVSDLEARIEAKRAELRGVDARISDLQARIRERSEKVASLEAIGKAGTCPTCFQPLLDSYEQVVAELESDIEACNRMPKSWQGWN